MGSNRYREVFLEEAREILQILNHCLVALERAPADGPILGEIYRAVHTLKSMAATLDFQRTADLCHGLESVLDRLLKGTLPPTPDLLEMFFRSADQLERVTGDAEGGEAWDENSQSLLEEVTRAATEAATSVSRSDPTVSWSESRAVVSAARATAVRINVKRLDSLINLTGELLIIKSRLRTLVAALNAPALKEAVDQLERVSDSLQREVLQARMLPIGSVFSRFSRMVRDLARESGKQVELVVNGHEIELDRTILDDMNEPLIHLIRNAVSYGIEAPTTRARLGKPEAGTITLSASREADRVVLEVDDDGKGIDLEELRAVALEKGFMSAEQAQTLSSRDLIGFLFLPGFSTATAVSGVSGRGVGLSVVKTRVEALRGSIDVKSAPGRGTRFILRFPPTLAILEALLVRVGGEMFAIPMVDVGEVVEIDRADFESASILVTRGRAIPLMELARLLDLAAGPARQQRAFALISSLPKGAAGFIVDEVAGRQEIVIKPVERLLKHVAAISGATILGDGRVVLILDLHALVREEGMEQSGRAQGVRV